MKVTQEMRVNECAALMIVVGMGNADQIRMHLLRFGFFIWNHHLLNNNIFSDSSRLLVWTYIFCNSDAAMSLRPFVDRVSLLLIHELNCF